MTAPTETNTPAPDAPQTFDQAAVNKIVAERVAREQAKFSDHADLKAKAAELDKIQAANASEMEKAVTKARDEGRAEVSQAANLRLVQAEARALAAAAKARNPLVAVRSLDLTGVKVAEDGTVDAAAIQSKLDELVKSDPYLFDDGRPIRPAGDAGQGPRADALPTDPRAADLAQIELDMKAGARRT